ncbi:MAG TPA: polysaccharide biosynthesis/export family protein [Rudaea sp.]|jgi:polysaccharide export outer membrane protein|uniref:polysaccharide biosynthesis/export family protein n=1 Tax=Rudaea sp. TaxID=2136325 RepID=UPI002F93F86E
MKLLFFRFFVACFVAIVLVGCDSVPVRTTHPAGVPLPPPDTTNASGAYQGQSDYRIGAQDLLDVTVFGVPDLSRTVRVNSNGQISLPLIGGVQAGGHTIPELEQALADLLAKSYLQNPQVSVFVKEFTSQRITLEGSLKNPGIYPITGKTTLLQAVAIAGGLDPLADLKGVVVFRQIEGKKMAALFDLRQIQAGRSLDPQVFGDDVIVVEQSGSKSAERRVLEAIPIIGLFLLL